jgi:hypothetical protein
MSKQQASAMTSSIKAWRDLWSHDAINNEMTCRQGRQACQNEAMIVYDVPSWETVKWWMSEAILIWSEQFTIQTAELQALVFTSLYNYTQDCEEALQVQWRWIVRTIEEPGDWGLIFSSFWFHSCTTSRQFENPLQVAPHRIEQSVAVLLSAKRSSSFIQTPRLTKLIYLCASVFAILSNCTCTILILSVKLMLLNLFHCRCRNYATPRLSAVVAFMRPERVH